MRIEKYAETPEDQTRREIEEANEFADLLINKFDDMRKKAGEPIKIIINYDEPEFFMIEQALSIDEEIGHAFTNKLQAHNIFIDKRSNTLGAPITVECFK